MQGENVTLSTSAQVCEASGFVYPGALRHICYLIICYHPTGIESLLRYSNPFHTSCITFQSIPALMSQRRIHPGPLHSVNKVILHLIQILILFGVATNVAQVLQSEAEQ